MRSLVTVSPCNFLLSSIAGWATCSLLPYRSNHAADATPQRVGFYHWTRMGKFSLFRHPPCPCHLTTLPAPGCAVVNLTRRRCATCKQGASPFRQAATFSAGLGGCYDSGNIPGSASFPWLKSG